MTVFLVVVSLPLNRELEENLEGMSYNFRETNCYRDPQGDLELVKKNPKTKTKTKKQGRGNCQQMQKKYLVKEEVRTNKIMLYNLKYK